MIYRTRQRTVEAVRWEGQAIVDLPTWAQNPFLTEQSGSALSCYTKQGPVRANKGDWLILGEREIYPCSDEEFTKRYEPVEPAETSFAGAESGSR